METEPIDEVLASTLLGLASAQLRARPLHAESLEPLPDIRVELVEFRGGVPGAEVLAPPAQHGVEPRYHVTQVLVATRVWGQLLHALPNALHRTHARPTLEEVDPAAFPLPDWTAQTLVQVAAEKVETLLALRELHLPRLLGMQLEAETRH